MMTSTETMCFAEDMRINRPPAGSRGAGRGAGRGRGPGIGKVAQDIADRARRGYERFGGFFRIGCGYDWEAQYHEYQAFWEAYFQGLSGRG